MASQGQLQKCIYYSCGLLRYEHQLAEISDKEVTISPSPETSPVLLGLLLLSVLLNMAAAPQLSNYLSNLLSNRDRSGFLDSDRKIKCELQRGLAGSRATAAAATVRPGEIRQCGDFVRVQDKKEEGK